MADTKTILKTAGKKVVGIIYTYDITMNRVSFDTFRKLCGNEALKNVVFVTTRWGNSNPATEAHNEQALQYKLQHELSSAVAIVRHNNSESSAKAIVRSLLCKTPVDLALRGSAARATSQNEFLSQVGITYPPADPSIGYFGVVDVECTDVTVMILSNPISCILHVNLKPNIERPSSNEERTIYRLPRGDRIYAPLTDIHSPPHSKPNRDSADSISLNLFNSMYDQVGTIIPSVYSEFRINPTCAQIFSGTGKTSPEQRHGGIIYTCSVNENRVRPVNVFDAFRKLCGDDAMPVVTVVTTGWDHLRDRSVVTVLVGQFDYTRVNFPQLCWLQGKLYFYQLCPVIPLQHLNLCSFCIHMYSPRQSYGSPPPELSNNPFIDHPANALSRFPDISAGADTANSGQYTSWLQQPGQSGSMLASNPTGYPGQGDFTMYGGGAYQQPQPTGWHASSGYFQPQQAYGAPPMQPQTTGRPGFQPSSSFGQQLAAQVNTAYTGVPQQQPQYTGYPQMQAPSQFGAGYQPGYASQQPQQNPQYIAELDPYGPGSQPSYSGSSATGYRPPHPREYVQQHKAELETWDSYSWKQIQNSFDALKEAWGARKRDIENRARSLGGAGLFGGGGYGAREGS
ncbi:predicted protein [Postia placenta Mad-698-R]|nr:predicted protein [Postia placenta Mad-698-R]